ncbi:type II secretion system inner membrane protein GspF [Pollutimonas bauzanensis]|uniref:General secretion pathway protein F n=1 Tax=Pollutimonas bauzanensis TaxID=658167 RepID=A0A1M6BEH1_9BURK|nr:type II secretion system inner membrane protein GspF [Pollutimonas bauzanensis]SHI46968.1 general secretion pathway protein F [Pollutimonas bauzanensis]
MPTFQYEAADAQGRIELGRLEADSPRGARAALRGRGLSPLAVAEKADAGAGASWFGKKLSNSDLAWATRELASLLSAGLPLESALVATIEQAERKHVAQTLAEVCENVRGGMRFADALAQRPKDFPDIYRALVGAGEDSGDQARVLERLADYLEGRDALRSKILTAFIYPIIVAVISVCIVVFLLGYVVPQVVSAFSQSHQELPVLTRVMLALSGFVREWGALTAALAGLAFWAWRRSLQNPATRLAWHSRLLRMPVISKFVLGVNTARFASTLSILRDAGVPMLRALEAARETMGNERMRGAASDVIGRVKEGETLAAALKAQRLFPSNLIHMVASGEKTGALAPMLDRAAQNLSRDLERRALRMTAMLEPLMTVGMGGMVLMIVLAVMMPIMELNQMVQ